MHMIKSEKLFVRLSPVEKRKFLKASKEYKNLSAFLLSAGRTTIKYRRVIEQAEKLSKQYNPSAMKVRSS